MFKLKVVWGATVWWSPSVFMTSQSMAPVSIAGGMAPEEPSEPESDPLSQAPSRRLVVYPGKFKPPHRGHLGLVESLTQHLKRPQDKILVLISPLSLKTDDGLEISAKDSKNIWKLYLAARNLTDKVELLVSPLNSPVKAAYAVLDNEIDGHETKSGDFIIPGASTKVDDKSKLPDWSRFARFHEYDANVSGISVGKADEWAVEPIVDDSGVELSASDFRAAIDNGENVSRWLPEEIDDESFYAALRTPGTQQESLNHRFFDLLEGTFQKNMKRRLKGAHKRLLDKGGQKNTPPFVVKRPKTSNAFIAKEEQELEEMSAASGAGAAVEGSPAGGKKTKVKASYNTWSKTGTKAMSYEDFAEEIKLRRTIKEGLKQVRRKSLAENRDKLLQKTRLRRLMIAMEQKSVF